MPVRALSRSPLARNTAWMLLSHLGRTLVQAVYFVLIARALGAAGYGAFVGATALVAIASPFASWGTGNLLVRAVARDPREFPRYWGMALWTTVIGGTGLAAILAALAGWVLPASVPVALVVVVAAADLICIRLLEASGQAFQAFQRLGRTAQLQFLPTLLRLLAVAGMVAWTDRPTVMRWAVLFLLASALSMMAGLVLVTRELGRPRFERGMARGELREGFHFATSLSAQNVYNDLDKTLLARLSTLGSAGVYAAAYRVIDVAFAPVRALLAASYARFFQHGRGGIAGSLAFALRLLPLGVGYALAAGAGLVALGPVLVAVLGNDYADVTVALRYLALIPLLRVVHYLAADALTGAGHQAARSGVQIGVAVLNVVLNLALIPRLGWRGAALTSIASDAALAVGLWLLVLRYRLRSPAPQGAA
jgi:O-antigen/teichoic acid export membrane protein